MELYKKDNISISTIEEQDKEKVLEYFSENTFNCDYETGALRPTNSQFNKIMDEIISGDDESNIFVLKKDDQVIGYESVFVEYDKLIIGHIAVDKKERNKGYGELLTKIALLISENDDRDVSLYCNHYNKYLSKLNFETTDNIHYLYKRRGIKNELLPKLFVSVKDYEIRVEQRHKSELENFSRFLKESKILELIL